MANGNFLTAGRILSASFVALSIASTAFASPEVQGPGTTGGGNKCRMRIFDVNDLLAQGLREGRFKKLIELSPTDIPKQVAGVEIKIGHDLIHDKEEVDAINDPDTQTITVDEKVCKEESNFFFTSVLNLLIHEHFGLARVDDEKFRHSRGMRPEVWDFVSKLFSSKEDEDSCYSDAGLEKKKQLASLVAKKPYENLIVNGGEKSALEKMMAEWLVAEMNFPSAMRDQVGDTLFRLTDNGHNSYVDNYRNRKGESCRFIRFTGEHVKLKRVKKLNDKRSLFKASFHTSDGNSGGTAAVRMDFLFEAEIQPSQGNGKFYDVKAMSYPIHSGTQKFDCMEGDSAACRLIDKR
jgi:hypothetical protein